jgi:hypothetical protein
MLRIPQKLPTYYCMMAAQLRGGRICCQISTREETPALIPHMTLEASDAVFPRVHLVSLVSGPSAGSRIEAGRQTRQEARNAV